MARMEIANVMVNVGGDAGNQVPRDGVSPGEIAVLRSIHGEDAVHSVLPVGFEERDQRDERTRLVEFYGRSDTNRDILKGLFPAPAHLPLTLKDLRLDESFYAAVTRAEPAAAPAADGSVAPAPEQPVAEADGFDVIQDEHTAAEEAKEPAKRGRKTAAKEDIFG